MIKKAKDEIEYIRSIMNKELKEKLKQRPDQICMINHMLITLSAICTALYNL
jgi:hypothetical protein